MPLLPCLSLGLFGCLLFGPFMDGVQAQACRSGWIYYNYYCYGYFPQEVTWSQAQALCRRRHGYLGEIVDGEEPRELAGFLTRRGAGKNVWVQVDFRRMWLTTDSALDRTSGFLMWKGMSSTDRLPYLCMEQRKP